MAEVLFRSPFTGRACGEVGIVGGLRAADRNVRMWERFHGDACRFVLPVKHIGTRTHADVQCARRYPGEARLGCLKRKQQKHNNHAKRHSNFRLD